MKKLVLIFLIASIAACSPSKHTASSQSTIQTPSSPNADGSSYEKAIVIQGKSETTGVAAEYKWIRDNYPGSESQGQALMNNNSKPYDVITIKTSDGTIKKIYFDISNFFGKF